MKVTDYHEVVAGVLFLLVCVHLSHPCFIEGTLLICSDIPANFPPGISSLLMLLKDVGEINSTVLQSENLNSITRLRIENAGVTRIAEKAFGSFCNLRNVSLNMNKLSQFNSNWFGKPTVLTELSLTENQIEVLNESTLSGLTSLTNLRLNKNMIRTIEQNSFSSQTILAELDLSQNKLTCVSPQVFRSLNNTRIRLDGNPWRCSCEAEDFVAFVKDLQSRSLLDKPMDVTCESPLSVKGQLVWNVSVCATSTPSVTLQAGPSSTVKVVTTPSSRSTPKTETSFKPDVPAIHTETSVHPKLADARTSGPSSTVKVTTSPSRIPKTETSFKPKLTDAPTITSSHTGTRGSPLTTFSKETSAPTPKTETSFKPKPTDAPAKTSSHAGTYVPSPLTETETSVHVKPTNSPTAASEGVSDPSNPLSDANVVHTLIAVIVVLCVLLFVVCFLAVLRRRKRSKETVTPGHPKKDKKQQEEKSSPSHDQSLGSSEIIDAEMAWVGSFTGVRAKSANAVILTSPFCASWKDPVTLHTEAEAQTKATENPAQGKQKQRNETEAAAAGEIHKEHLTNTADMVEEIEKQVNPGTNPDENPQCVPVNTDMVPYLSIGTSQNKPNPAEESTDGAGQRLQGGKVIKRISTWPPTATQWQASCKMKAEEVEGNCFTVWTQNITEKFLCEVKKTVKEMEHPSSSDGGQKEDETEKNQMNLRLSQSSKPTEEEQLKKDRIVMDELATVTQTALETQNVNQETLSQSQVLASAKTSAPNNACNKKRKEAKRAVHSRQRAENGASSLKAPSGGTTPDDETLLSGNEFAFMNLLHEVVQNNGRWTRQRWKQTHVKKQWR